MAGRESSGRWALPFVTALGGLLAGLIVFTLRPKRKGTAPTPRSRRFTTRAASCAARVPPIKLVASAITIGSGGSGGREGPAAQISAGFGSHAGQLAASRRRSDRRIAVAAGMGAGIGAIFRAPLGGAVMAAEILYLHDLEVEALIPGLIASIVGYSVFGAIEGWEPIFGAQPDSASSIPDHSSTTRCSASSAALVGLLYAASFYGIERDLPPAARAALAQAGDRRARWSA